MIALLITIADFSDFVPFSVNIAPLLVNPHIRDAQQFDVWPLLPFDLRVDLSTPAGSWQPAITALFTEFVKPLLVLESARRMLLWHGAHVTPNGLESISEVGHQPVSGAQRTELRADLIAKANYYRPRLEAALRAAYPTAYPSSCAAGRRPRGSGGLQISAV